MRVNRRGRRFHDPHGFVNNGSIVRVQWLVSSHVDTVNGLAILVDQVSRRENTYTLVLAGKDSVERLRK